MRHTAAFARSAVMARPAAIERTREVGGTRQRRGAAEFLLDPIAKERLLARERHRRLELAVGKMLQPFCHAGDADIFLDQIVVRSEIAVSERPVFVVAILGGRLEIRVAETQTNASPNVRAASCHAQAPHPIEGLVGRRGVGFFKIVDEPVIVVFAADVEFRLDGTGLAYDLGSEIPVLQLECGFVFGEVGIGLRAASLEQRDFDTRFRQALTRPTAGCTGADHENIEVWTAFRGHGRRMMKANPNKWDHAGQKKEQKKENDLPQEHDCGRSERVITSPCGLDP